MRISKRFQIEKAVADANDVRAPIREVYLDMETASRPRLVATNGRIMAIVPVETEDGDSEGFIKPEAFSTGRKGTSGRMDTYGLSANREIRVQTVKGTSIFPRTAHGEGEINFPRWRRIAEKSVNDKKQKYYSVTLDAELLYRLSQAIGSDEVHLMIPEDGQEVILVRSNRCDAYGFICPIMRRK